MICFEIPQKKIILQNDLQSFYIGVGPLSIELYYLPCCFITLITPETYSLVAIEIQRISNENDETNIASELNNSKCDEFHKGNLP